jgi:protein TonB
MSFPLRLVVPLLALAAVACAGRGRVFTAGPDVTLPTVVTIVHASYTPEAMRARIQGSVLLDCVVRPDGTVSDVIVTQSLDSATGLDRQAVDAMRQWKFKPGTRKGKPVAVRVSVKMAFTMQ